MKLKLRITSLLVACVCAVGSVASLSASAAVLRGDVNGDGKVDITDSVALNQFLAGKNTVSDLTRLDFNSNYIIDQADADDLLRFLTHLTS